DRSCRDSRGWRDGADTFCWCDDLCVEWPFGRNAYRERDRRGQGGSLQLEERLVPRRHEFREPIRTLRDCGADIDHRLGRRRTPCGPPDPPPTAASASTNLGGPGTPPHHAPASIGLENVVPTPRHGATPEVETAEGRE